MVKEVKMNKTTMNAPFALKLFLCLLTCQLSNNPAFSAGLLDIYNQALQNNPSWAAKKAALRADREFERLGQAGLLPQIYGNLGQSQINYKSDGLSLTNTSDNGFNDFIDCLAGSDPFGECLDASPGAQACLSFDFIDCLFGASGSSSSSFSSRTYGITLVQPIFRMDRWYEYRRNQSLAERAKVQFNVAYQDFNLRVVETYFAFLKAEEQAAFLNSEEKSILFQLNSTKRRFEKGLVSSIDVLEAQSIFDLHQASRILAETQVESAREDLRQLAGGEVLSVALMPLNIPLEKPTPDNLDTWVDLSTRNSPDLKLAEISTQVANRRYQISRSKKLPQVDFSAGYIVTDSGGETTSLSEGETTSTSLALNLRVPIYTGGALTASEKQSKFKKIESDFIRHDIFQKTVGSVKKLYLTTLSALKRVSAQAVAIQSSEKAFGAVKRGYQRGARSIAELLDAQRDYFLAKKNYAEARIDYVLTSIQLKRAAGLIDKVDLETIDSWLVDDSTENTISAPISQKTTDKDMLKRLFDNISP